MPNSTLRFLLPAVFLLACDPESGSEGGGLPADGEAVCAMFPIADVEAAAGLDLGMERAGGNDTPPRCVYEGEAADPVMVVQIDEGSAWSADKDFALDIQMGMPFDDVGQEGVLVLDFDTGTTQLGGTDLWFLSAADASVLIQWYELDSEVTTAEVGQGYVVPVGQLVERALTE